MRAAGVETFRIAVGHVEFVDGLLEDAIEKESDRNQFRQFLYERDFVGFRQLLSTLDIDSEAKDRLGALLRLEGGTRGGTIVGTGTPEEVAKLDGSYTGIYLKPILERDKARTVAKLEQLVSK